VSKTNKTLNKHMESMRVVTCIQMERRSIN